MVSPTNAPPNTSLMRGDDRRTVLEFGFGGVPRAAWGAAAERKDVEVDRAGALRAARVAPPADLPVQATNRNLFAWGPFNTKIVWSL